MHKSLWLVSCLLFACFISAANAHHGFSAHFDPDNVIRIEGTVKQFDFINPHGLLYIDSVNDSGEPVVYVCDLQARNQLVRKGADETLFTVGEPIVVMGFAARRDPLGCEFGVGYFSDGSSFTMRSIDEARTKFAENEATPIAHGASRSIFGNWLRPGMFGYASGRGERTGVDSITAEGKAAVAAFDPVTENPVIRCEAPSPVHSWGPPGLATSIRQENGKIIIYHESMDTTRTVHLDMDEHPNDLEPSNIGHSIGRFEDGVLTIDTAAFSEGVLVGSILHTDKMTLHERVSIEEDTERLLIEWTVVDPTYYAEPLTGSQQLQSTSKEILQYDCMPEAPALYE